MNHADPLKTVARNEDARPTLSFHNAGVQFGRAPVHVVAERVDTDIAYLLGPSDGRFHLWEVEGRLVPGQTVRFTRRDVQPLRGFEGRVGPVPSRARAPKRKERHRFAPTRKDMRGYYASVLSEVGGLPSLPLDLESELPRALELVEFAVEAAAHRHAPIDTNVTAKSVGAWEAVGPFQARLVEAVESTLSDALRAALHGAGTDFVRVCCTAFKLQADSMYLDANARKKPIGVPYMNRAMADSWRRLKRLTFGQYLRVAESRVRRGKEEPDPEVMQERIDKGAAAIEAGTDPDPRTAPYHVLVARPPAARKRRFPKRTLDKARLDRRAREGLEGLDALEAKEARDALRRLAHTDLDRAIVDAIEAGQPRGCWSEIAKEFGVRVSTVTRRRDALREKMKAAS